MFAVSSVHPGTSTGTGHNGYEQDAFALVPAPSVQFTPPKDQVPSPLLYAHESMYSQSWPVPSVSMSPNVSITVSPSNNSIASSPF